MRCWMGSVPVRAAVDRYVFRGAFRSGLRMPVADDIENLRGGRRAYRGLRSLLQNGTGASGGKESGTTYDMELWK
jgi:hypothetical protein